MELYKEDSDKLALTREYFTSLVPPTDNYEKVLWLNRLKDELSWLALVCGSESYSTLEHIKNTKEESPDYEIVPIWSDKNESDVDWDLLKEELPDAYEKSLSFPPTAAAALIGMDKITELCITEAGEERVRHASNPSVGKLKKALTKSEQPRYIKVVRKQTGSEIVLKAKSFPQIE